jgi:PGF-CTERM protein
VNERALSVVLTALLVMSSLSAAGAGLASASTSGNAAGNATTFHVTQAGQCYEVAAMGDGSQSVEDFYDYRKPNNTDPPEYTYSSHGTKHLQDNQVSNVFVYHGTDGYSVVMLHDKLDEDGNEGKYGSTITFNFSNMDGVSWKVRDDNYTIDGEEQDDNWDIEGADHSVDWMWADNRTDGGAFSGFGNSEVTITPYFNESAPKWGKTPHTGNEQPMNEWRLLREGDTNVSLDMSQKLSVAKGSCPDTTNPEADLTANPSTVGNDEEVTLDASGSSDDGSIDRYEWDFDGDGTVDRTTTKKDTVNHTYESPDDYTASVEVFDEAGNSDVATAKVTVTDQSDSNISYINATAVEVEGSYEEVQLTLGYYTENGYGQSSYHTGKVSGTTVINIDEDYGVNGTMINLVELYEDNFPGESDHQKEHPRLDYYAETIEPHPVNVSVESVTESGDGTYDVTFGYDNPNEEQLTISNSTFTSGNVSGEPPTTFESGEHTFTTTWTPDSDDERATWTLNRSQFDQSDVSASTKTAGEYNDSGEGDTADPEADLTATPTEGYGETEFAFDASSSSDDEGIDEYRWDFDADGVFDRTTDGPKTTHTYSETGTHEVTVQTADAAGNTDTASTNVTVFKVGSGDDDPPTAKLSVPDEGSMSQLLYPFDATGSTDDDGIVKYKWDFDSDGKFEWNEHEDGISSMKPYQVLDEPGTYTVTVTVVDTTGQTDTATAQYKVEKIVPDASIEASSDTVEVGEEVTFTATNFNEPPEDLAHICWKVGHEEGPDGQTWTTSFEESGKKTIKLVLRDRAGYEHVVKKTFTVTAADDGGDDNEDSYKDDPNEGDKSGGLPPASSGDGDDSQDGETVKAPLNGEDAEMGEIALMPAADADPALEVNQTAPANVEAPSVAEDGFEALSYVTVADAERTTFTVSKDRLDAAGVTAADVTLFRYEDGAWTAVETEQVNETDDAVEFAANTTDATYAVGVDRPATSVTDLAVENQRVEPGETVTVVATVSNDGRADGTHEVQFTVGSDVVATQTVSVGAGATEQVSLTHTFDDSGVYDVSVEGEQAEVVVEGIETSTTDDSSEVETSTSTTDDSTGGVPGFGVGVSLVALLGAALLALRRR